MEAMALPWIPEGWWRWRNQIGRGLPRGGRPPAVVRGAHHGGLDAGGADAAAERVDRQELELDRQPGGCLKVLSLATAACLSAGILHTKTRAVRGNAYEG